MRGIAGYSMEQGRWHVYTAPEGTEASLFFSETYRWDGLIVRVTDAALARRVRRLGVPAVSIASVRVPSSTLPRVKVDDDALTAAAVRHLVSAGLRRFAYCGWFPRGGEDRGPAFQRQLAGKGFDCDFYADSTRLAVNAPWQSRQRELGRWVKRLAKPVGILTWNPDIACQLIEACDRSGVRVPEQAAIVTADDDQMKCELSSPTISAIEIPAARIGYEAAALLDRLMSGEAPPAAPILIEPSGIVTVRESSNTFDLPDRDVHMAVQFIRENASRPLSVEEVARSLTVSRRWLERHFRRAIGHSPYEEMQRSRLELAKKMLLETDLEAARIATASGFNSAPYFNHFFRRHTGLTPLEFRRRYRLGGVRQETVIRGEGPRVF